MKQNFENCSVALKKTTFFGGNRQGGTEFAFNVSAIH